MGIKTRTFPTSIKPTTTTAITEVFHLRDMTTDFDDELAIYLEAIYCNGSLASFQLFRLPDFDGDETEAEKLSKFTTAENASQKFGLKLLTRKTGEVGWREKAEIIMVNRGRKDYFDLLNPYLAQRAVRILEQNDEIAIQLVDYGYGLLKDNDFLELEFAIRIESEKKNNEVEQLRLDLETLKLAIDGKLTNLPSESLLGRNANTGTVEIINQSKFVVEQRVIELIESYGGGGIDLSSVEQLLESNFKSKFFIESHYLSLSGGGNFPVSGANGGYGYMTAEVGHPGIAGLNTGLSSNGFVSASTGIGNNSSGILLDNGPTSYRAIIKIPLLRDTTNDYAIEIGFQSAGNSIGLDACCFVYEALSPNWQCHTRNNGDLAIFTSNIAVVANQWIEMEIAINSGIAIFRVNGIQVLNTSQKLPLSPRMVGAGIDIRKVSGTNGRDIWIDYQSVKQIFLNLNATT